MSTPLIVSPYYLGRNAIFKAKGRNRGRYDSSARILIHKGVLRELVDDKLGLGTVFIVQTCLHQRLHGMKKPKKGLPDSPINP